MSKAEDLAEKAYPQEMDGYCENNAAMRVGFKIGYNQAEKDLELSWEDIRLIDTIASKLLVSHGNLDDEGFFKEVLKHFNDFKERKENRE